MIRMLGLLISIGILVFYSSFKSKENELKQTALAEIEKLMEKEDYESIMQLANDKVFMQKWEASNCYERGKIDHLIGKVFYINNREQEAITYFKKAVYKDWKHCSLASPKEIANTIYNIGVCYQYTDQISLGKFYIDTTMTLIEKMTDYPKPDLARKYQGAGSYFADLRDFTRSETYLNNALRLSDSLDVVDAYYIHIDLLSLYIKFKKYEKAYSIIETINHKYIESASLFDLDKAIFYLNSAEVFLRSGDLDKAENICKKAIGLLPKEEINFISNAYEILGVVYYKKGKYDLSEVNYTKAYQLRLDENNIVQANVAKSFALENLSELETANGQNDKALSKINDAIMLNSIGLNLDNKGNPIIKNYVISNGFHLLRQLALKEKIIYRKYSQQKQQSQLSECLQLHIKMDTLIDNVLANAYLDQAKLELLDNMANHSSRAVEVCLELYTLTKNAGYYEKAFYFSSRSKAVLLQKLITSNNHLANLTADSIKIAYNKLKNTLNDVQKNLQLENSNKDSLMKAFASIQLNFAQFETKHFGSKNENYSSVKHQLSIKDLQKNINERTILIDFFNSDESLIVFTISNKHFSFKKIRHQKIDSIIATLKKQCVNPFNSFDKQLSHKLYSMLFDSIPNNILKQNQSLIVIPDGQLHGFPMETLIDENGQFLIYKWDCKYAYVAAITSEKKQTPDYKNTFVGYATNYSGQLNEHLINKGMNEQLPKLSNLSVAEKELNICANLYDGKAYYGNEANIDHFYKEALNTKIVYLSLHSILDKEDGARSSLVFDDRNKEFLLRAFELHKQPMVSELVVLSACHTADGKWQSGEGINGITRAFLASGVSNVVSSLWSASEGSSLQILPQFLHLYKKENKAAIALQEAKIDYLKKATPQLQHPYYWANYLIISGLDADGKAGFDHMNFVYWFIAFLVLLLLVIGVLRLKKK